MAGGGVGYAGIGVEMQCFRYCGEGLDSVGVLVSVGNVVVRRDDCGLEGLCGMNGWSCGSRGGDADGDVVVVVVSVVGHHNGGEEEEEEGKGDC